MSDKTAILLVEEIQERLTELQALVGSAPVNAPDGSVIHDKKNNSWHGISREARRLKVTPQHLARVLRGERKSNRIMQKVQVTTVK